MRPLQLLLSAGGAWAAVLPLSRHALSGAIRPRTYTASPASLPLFDFFAEYTVNVSVGSPALPFRMVLDTASGNTWLPTPQCNDYVASPHCMAAAKYNSAADTSYTKCTSLCLLLMPLTDGNQTLIGELGNTSFALGGLRTPSAALGMMTSVPLPRLSGQAYDGVVGLAFQNGSTVPLLQPPAPLLSVLAAEGQLAAPVFSLFLNRGDAPGVAGRSAWLLGGADFATYSSGAVVTLAPVPFWQAVLGLWAVTMDYVFGAWGGGIAGAAARWRALARAHFTHPPPPTSPSSSHSFRTLSQHLPHHCLRQVRGRAGQQHAVHFWAAGANVQGH